MSSPIQSKFGDWAQFIDFKELSNIGKQLTPKYATNSITPNSQDTFKSFELCSYGNCKVIMIGQDPYPQKGVATGILFGNRRETEILSPSLNIIKNSCIDWHYYHNSITFDPTLESWAKQGILMLNSSLTTEINITGKHANIWRPLISKFLKSLSNTNTGIIYVLFGEQAKTLKPYINSKVNYIIEEKHPSYYSRLGIEMPSNIFKSINNLLWHIYGEKIEWYEEQEDYKCDYN